MTITTTPWVYTTTHTGTVPISNGGAGGTGGTGGTGQYIFSNGTNTTWTDTISISQDMSPNTLLVKGNAEFDGDIKLQGKSLNDTLSKIEERLAILHPNERLEEKWAKLKELRKQYQELETDILEKEKIMEILKR